MLEQEISVLSTQALVHERLIIREEGDHASHELFAWMAVRTAVIDQQQQGGWSTVG